MMKWIACYDAATHNLIGKYISVRQASEKTGLEQHKISNSIRFGYKTSGCYFKRECFSKEKLAEKKLLTIEEYLYLHNKTTYDLAEMIGISQTMVSKYIAKTQIPNSQVKHKLDALGIISNWEINHEKRKKESYRAKKEKIYAFNNDKDGIYCVLRFVEKKEQGIIYCISNTEADYVSQILKSNGIINYIGHTNYQGDFVKYDRTLKEEVV